MTRPAIALALTVAAALACARVVHAQHAHGGGGGAHDWEWAGVFEMPTDAPATWTFQKVDGAYADDTMEFCWLSVDTNDAAGIEAAEPHAEECYEHQNATAVMPGTTLARDTLYLLTFDQNAYASSWKVDPVAGKPNAVFFLQHFPIEFEDTAHFLKDKAGADIEPGAQEPETPEPEKPNKKGLAYLASFIVVLVSFTGVVLVNKAVLDCCGGFARFANSSAAFASGALLFCAFTLLLPEAMHMIGAKPEHGEAYSESEVSAVYAVSFTVGVAACIALEVLIHKRGGARSMARALQIESGTAVAKGKEEQPVAATTALCDISRVHPIAWQVIVGDFFHNLVDGVVVGAAFMSCDTAAGWTVTAGTIYHEISQEVADFLVLVNKGKMTFKQACLGNFVSALGIVVGCMIVTESEPGQRVQGGLMAFGASFYVYVALSELQWWKKPADLLRNAFIFFIGCLGIGLVLISHEHCTPVSGADPHAGHNH